MMRVECLAALGAALVLLVAGCATNPLAPSVSSSERLELETRAVNQLLAAADSSDDIAACNAIESLVRVAPREGMPAFRRAVRSPSPMVRYAGLVALGEVRDRTALPLATSAIDDESPFVRIAGAFAAARLGKTGYARVLVNKLNSAAPENQRADAASLLGRLEEPRARPWLRAALKYPTNAKSQMARLAIYGALARLGDDDALTELIQYAQGDTAARAESLLILADLAKPGATDALRYRLLGAKDEYVEARLIAARGLGRLGYDDGYDLAMQHVNFVDGNLRPSPDNPNRTYPVRSMAIHALGEIGDPRALPTLRQIAASSDDPRLQVAASYAIVRILKKAP